MYRRYNKCYCHHKCNNCDNDNDSDLENILEDKCDNVAEYDDDDDCGCKCGFDNSVSVFPENAVLAQSYVPFQYMDKTFKPCVGLKMGTIFPELVSPYMPCQSIEEIEFIKATNKIGKGCNR